MKIQTIKIENFRSIKGIEIDFMKNLNVLVGINGSGKTTILDAISIVISWLVNRIQRQNASGNLILDTDIRNETPFSAIKVSVIEKDENFEWKLIKIAKGVSNPGKSELNGVSELASLYQESLLKETRLPVLAYYPVTRVVNKTIPEVKGKENLYILDVYDNALGGKRNYHSFFEWFRLQDDIVNEEAMSRSKWIQLNQDWIKRRIKKLLDLMKTTFSSSNSEFNKGEYKYLIERFDKDELIYKEPRFLFHELSRLMDMAGMHSHINFKYEKIFHDLEYMFHKMEMFSREYRDDLIDEGGRYEEIIVRVIRGFRYTFKENKPDNNTIEFVWEAFVFANILSLWWLSEKGKRTVERELRKYLPNLNYPDTNWEFLSEKLIAILKQVIKNEINQKKSVYKGEGQELKAVAKAIEQFVPEYSLLRVKRAPRPHMLINKGKETFNLDQLSDGEKNLITLVGDIARRLAIANPNSKEPLKGEGIILIDEIDLHLHPKWQRLMIPQLTKVFPNCQFIITTHSPQVLSHVKPESIFLLNNENNELSYSKAIESFGMNSDRILEDLLVTDARPIEIKKQLHKLFKLIQDGDIEKAKTVIEDFEDKGDPELVKARVLIKRKELIGK